MTVFDPTTAILSYLNARGSAPEDDIIRVVEAREEEAFGDATYTPVVVPWLLHELVACGCLLWRDPPGGDGTGPLVYSIRPAPPGGVS